jgi:hypothetical protein
MVRLAKVLGPTVVSLAYPGFRPKESTISQLVESLESLKLAKNDTVVLDLLSSVAFMGTNESSLPTEAERVEDERHHIIGSLATAPPSVTKKNLAACVPLIELLGLAGTVLISPVPRYIHNRRCEHVGDIENLTGPDLDEEIAIGLEGIKRLMCNGAVDHTLDFEVVDPTMLNDACDLGIKTRVTSSGTCLWGEATWSISCQSDTRTWPKRGRGMKPAQSPAGQSDVLIRVPSDGKEVALYALGTLANVTGAFGDAGRPTEDGRPPVVDEAGSGAGSTPPVFFLVSFSPAFSGNFYQLRDVIFYFFHMRFLFHGGLNKRRKK